jgi:hypothetical protein
VCREMVSMSDELKERSFSRMDGMTAKMCAGRWWACRMN